MVGQHGICPNCERLIKVDPWVVQEIEKRKKPVAEKPAEEPKRGAQNTPVMDEVVSGQPSSGLAVSSMVLGIFRCCWGVDVLWFIIFNFGDYSWSCGLL